MNTKLPHVSGSELLDELENIIFGAPTPICMVKIQRPEILFINTWDFNVCEYKYKYKYKYNGFYSEWIQWIRLEMIKLEY